LPAAAARAKSAVTDNNLNKTQSVMSILFCYR
jgi:hypothetical protein